MDRETDPVVLAREIIKTQEAELIVFLTRQHSRLQEKDAGESFTVENTVKLKEGELERMNRFFRGAVAPYYARQRFDVWDDNLPSKYVVAATKELKQRVGFMLYDHNGRITENVNSMTTFLLVRDLNAFLKEIEEVCFDDEGFIFPDSKHFKALWKEKGRIAAERQVFEELREKHRNRFFDRKIID